jgi:hypothetical protein
MTNADLQPSLEGAPDMMRWSEAKVQKASPQVGNKNAGVTGNGVKFGEGR